jgi:hypothetical protein
MIDDRLRRLKYLKIMLLLLISLILPVLIFGLLGDWFEDPLLRLPMYIFLSIYGGVLLWDKKSAGSWWEPFAAACVLLGAVHRLALYLPELSPDPFSLTWSEASRYYYASLFFSEGIYGVSTPPTVLHPSRYLLQTVPFIVPGASILAHRLWQVVLWITTTGMSAYFLVRRLQISGELRRWAIGAWCFLFILIAPVYYHLQVPAFLVLWLYDRQKPWRSLLGIALASAWAGISRVNWFPVPGMLAATLYFLEEPLLGRRLWQYLAKPAAWTILGSGLAFAVQSAYVALSGNPANQFISSFSSDLLWYRLWPNPTYPQGILPGALLVSLPFIILIAARFWLIRQAVHPLRNLAIAGVLLVLFGGGVIVSLKIGGGSNLHNLDAYLVILMVVCLYILADRLALDASDSQSAPTTPPGLWKVLMGVGLAVLVALPVYWTIRQGAPFDSFDPAEIQADMERLTRIVNDAINEGGEILFISERQMLTFGYFPGARLVPEYEKVFLMEMAMAGDQAYLSKFWEDLEQQRYALIVTDPLYMRLKGPGEMFGEENDAWVRNVSQKVLCNYVETRQLKNVALQLLTRQGENRVCPPFLPSLNNKERTITPED